MSLFQQSLICIECQWKILVEFTEHFVPVECANHSEENGVIAVVVFVKKILVQWTECCQLVACASAEY